MTERINDPAAEPAGRDSLVQTYIAMLRGINVSGKKIIKMEQLRACLAKLEFSNIKTYVQSGNIIFETSNDSAASLSRKIEQKILRDFGFSVPVFLKTSKEMEEAIKRNPFLKVFAIDHSKLHITFLSDAPPKTALEQLLPLAVKPDQFRIIGREIYLYCPNGYGNTRLSNTAIERKLSVGATTRNWTTAKTLLAMAQ
ncbi:MAG TPA: DUF1697 domain-containing protein [Candidatus Saccharimonadales bacterium]|nr:DUF1697 domain-containing protein [Candidatus Saccharimonadales bacterium]